MIKPRSISKEYTLIWSGDPSLDLPADEEARAEALRIARETGKWDSLVKPGEQPTLFHVRPMPGSAHSWLAGEQKRGRLSPSELFDLALRIVLMRVENLGDIKLKHDPANEQGIRMLSLDSLDALHAICRDAVEELGAIACVHAKEGVSPLA